MLKTGSVTPEIELLDQQADTPGCTQQSCGLSDIANQIGKTVIVGISPDLPAKQLKFDEKYKVWKKKSMYGREYMGIERSA